MPDKNPDISVVVPLFNEEESLPELSQWILAVADKHQYALEILFIDDGSTDSSWEVVRTLAKENQRIKGLRFRRNHGKSAALNAGFAHAKGEVVITMDADLQDSPDEIPGLYKMIAEERFDLISGWKKKRFDPISKTIPTKLFNWATRKISGIELHDFNCGLKAYRKEVIKNIEVYGELHRYIPFLAKNAGYKRIGERVVQHQARKYGTTKFGWERFINGFLDLLTLAFVSKFRRRPMHFFGGLGTLMFFLGFLSAAWIGASKLWSLHKGTPAILVTNNPWFFIGLTLMILGTLLFSTGFIAELIVRTSNNKGDYTLGEKINEDA